MTTPKLTQINCLQNHLAFWQEYAICLEYLIESKHESLCQPGDVINKLTDTIDGLCLFGLNLSTEQLIAISLDEDLHDLVAAYFEDNWNQGWIPLTSEVKNDISRIVDE